MNDEILPDVLQAGLAIVFCGMAAGKKSAAVEAYYAGPGNRFWRILHETGLTPRQLAPSEFGKLPRFGIGLTDMEKRQSGNDDELDLSGIDPQRVKDQVLRFEPKVLAFNSKTAARQFYRQKDIAYGRQQTRIGSTHVFVLPSTSGRNAHWPKQAHHWQALADFIGMLRTQS
jgi:TDG/mug DNA glycosylase family protein